MERLVPGGVVDGAMFHLMEFAALDAGQSVEAWLEARGLQIEWRLATVA